MVTSDVLLRNNDRQILRLVQWQWGTLAGRRHEGLGLRQCFTFERGLISTLPSPLQLFVACRMQCARMPSTHDDDDDGDDARRCSE